VRVTGKDGVRYRVEIAQGPMYPTRGKQRDTLCTIWGSDTPGTWTLLVIGVAQLHKGDTYVRAVGNQMAFERAMEAARSQFIPREDRKALWLAWKHRGTLKGWPQLAELEMLDERVEGFKRLMEVRQMSAVLGAFIGDRL
jgi:hypothetical protein